MAAEYRSKYEAKIAELKALLVAELGPAVEDVGPTDSLSEVLNDEQRMRFWQAMQRIGHHVQPLYSWRTWGEFWLKVIGSPRYHEPAHVHVWMGSNSLEQIAKQNVGFNQADYRKGLWPPEAIEARVRQIISEWSGVPVERITRETTFQEMNRW